MTPYLLAILFVKHKMAGNIQLVKDGGFGKYQKGENEIACTYANADLAVKAMLKFIEKKANK